MSYLNKEEVKELEDKLNECELVLSERFEDFLKVIGNIMFYGSLRNKEVFGVRLDDEYLANTNIRADNFLIEFCEHNNNKKEYYIVTGNHKGDRMINILKVKEG